MAFIIRVPFAPKRRWFRFSLRTLFVFVTVICVLGGLAERRIQEHRRQAAALGAFCDRGGGVTGYQSKITGWLVVQRLHTQGSSFTDDELRAVMAYFPGVPMEWPDSQSPVPNP